MDFFKFSGPLWKGGLGGSVKYPLLSDFSKRISKDYGVIIPDAGQALRGLFIIDPKVSMNFFWENKSR